MPKTFFTDEDGTIRPFNGVKCPSCGRFFVFRARGKNYEQCPKCGAILQKGRANSTRFVALAEVDLKPNTPFRFKPLTVFRKKRKRKCLPNEKIDWSKKEDRYKYHNAYIRGELSKMRRMFGNQCQVCGSQKQLEFAHLKPTGVNGRGRGRQTRLYDVKKNPEKYALLCRRCHLKFDRGEIKL